MYYKYQGTQNRNYVKLIETGCLSALYIPLYPTDIDDLGFIRICFMLLMRLNFSLAI